ncbi:37593_t:CDS:2 [Gigaspora margarita]|uniref:37593_t:CDS:1 n=1 Tax=Gigaspora margarita TaxID=4874 RepID=A0ABN7UHJ4_GIGMA|nr:37593_t:CDS:2 [Gigaspora margarita]
MVFGDFRTIIFANIIDDSLKISQAIKRYIKLEYDVNVGDNIELAIKDIADTKVANLNPNRDNGK